MLALALLVAAVSPQNVSLGLDVVTEPGNPAPSTGGSVFVAFGQTPGPTPFPPPDVLSAIDADGTVSFEARIGTGAPMAPTVEGIWKDQSGVLTPVVLAGDLIPGGGGATFTEFDTISFFQTGSNIANGVVTFLGSDTPATFPSEFEVYSDQGGALVLVLDPSVPIPGAVVGTPYDFAWRIQDGRMAFKAEFQTPFSQELRIENGGNFDLVAGSGNGAPDIPGATFQTELPGSEGLQEWAVNGNGEVAFVGHVVGNNITDADDNGVWFGDVNATSLLLREGDALPNLPGTTITSDFPFVGLHLNQLGELLFVARFQTADQVAGEALISTRSGTLQTLTYSLDGPSTTLPPSPVPGLAPGSEIRQILITDFNDEGEVAVELRVDSLPAASPRALFVDRGVGLQLVAAPTQLAPDLQAGEQFLFFTLHELDDQGSLWIGVTLDGSVPSNQNECLYVAPRGGVPRLVLREGTPLDLFGNGADVRTPFDYFLGRGEALDGTHIIQLRFIGQPDVLARTNPELSGFPLVCVPNSSLQAACTSCPCNNPGETLDGGCLNSEGRSAKLLVHGRPSAAMDTLSINVQDATSGTFCLLVSAANSLPQNPQNPCFGMASGVANGGLDGLLCVGGGLLRHGVRSTNVEMLPGWTGIGFGLDAGPMGGLVSASGLAPGSTRYFQAIYRDDANLSCGTGQNSTPAVEVTGEP